MSRLLFFLKHNFCQNDTDYKQGGTSLMCWIRIVWHVPGEMDQNTQVPLKVCFHCLSVTSHDLRSSLQFGIYQCLFLNTDIGSLSIVWFCVKEQDVGPLHRNGSQAALIYPSSFSFFCDIWNMKANSQSGCNHWPCLAFSVEEGVRKSELIAGDRDAMGVRDTLLWTERTNGEEASSRRKHTSTGHDHN